VDLIAVRVLVLIFSIVVHEVAHGWAAYRLGDDTAYRMGRLTLNPLPHIDPVGSIIVPIVLSLSAGIPFGWAKPVPVHVGRLNNPNNDHPKVAAAGPISNLLLALIFAILLGVTVAVGGMPHPGGKPTLLLFLYTMFHTGVMINVVLAVFNLLPFPPLDGSWILSRFLPPEARANFENLRRYGMMIVFGFILMINLTSVGDYFQTWLMLFMKPYISLATAIANLGA
jgi:Zn-dependent protease